MRDSSLLLIYYVFVLSVALLCLCSPFVVVIPTHFPTFCILYSDLLICTPPLFVRLPYVLSCIYDCLFVIILYVSVMFSHAVFIRCYLFITMSSCLFIHTYSYFYVS